MWKVIFFVALAILSRAVTAYVKRQQLAKQAAAEQEFLRTSRPGSVAPPPPAQDADEILVNDDMFGDAGPVRMPPTHRAPPLPRPMAPQRGAAQATRIPERSGERSARAPMRRETRTDSRSSFEERHKARGQAGGLGARLSANRAKQARLSAQRQAKRTARDAAMKARMARVGGKPQMERARAEWVSPFALAIRAVLSKRETARTGFLVGEILGRPPSES